MMDKVKAMSEKIRKSGTPGRVALIASPVAVLLLLVLVFGGSGCGREATAPVPSDNSVAQSPVPAAKPAAQSPMPAAKPSAAADDTGMSREERDRLSVQNQIKEILALAKKSAEEDFNINFGGFFVGMARADAVVLAEHYNLKDDEVSIAALPGKAVSHIWFSLKGVRRITKGGSTLEELAQAVANRVGDLKGYNGEWSHKTIDGVVVAFSGAGLTIRNDGAAQRNPIATSMAMQKEKADRKEVVLGIISDMVAIPEGVVIRVKSNENANELKRAWYQNQGLYNDMRAKMPMEEVNKRGVYSFPVYEDFVKFWRKTHGYPPNGIMTFKGRPFKMGKYEVTQKQWVAIMGNNPSRFKGKDNPVDSVPEADLKKFLAELNASPEVKAWGMTFRIPMKEEWEFACRAGGKGDYCRLADGTEITKYTLDKVAWHEGNSGKKSYPVGKKEPNAFGLYDMHGNVTEYCMDLSRDYSDWYCLGGSWYDNAEDCSAGSSSSGYSWFKDDVDKRARIGFRLVADRGGSPVVHGIIRDMVSIPDKNFKMGKYEVTQKQWVAIMGNNPSAFKGDDNPVNRVTWDECWAFLAKLNAMPEVKAARLTFRLPTGAEWEYACRAGGTGEYCRLADGSEISESTLGKVAWYKNTCEGAIHPVGQKLPNAFGLYDVHGNVMEWCEDAVPGWGKDADDRSFRASPGGCWCHPPEVCRLPNHCRHSPDDRNEVGFRLLATQK